ncbi:MAG TPA: YCF48-related protein [Pyrinomonadaceae bacterium]|jgi:photosystem II stability/assembly factor-like uncharacterized protein
MNDERGTMNEQRKAQVVSCVHHSSFRVSPFTFRLQCSRCSAHRSSFRVHRFLILLLICTLGASAQGAWQRQRSGTFAWLHAVYFLDAQRGWAVGSNGALLTTTDGGETWRVERRPTKDALRDVYFADENNGWLVCERAVYELTEKDEPRTFLMSTTDGGASWKRVEMSGIDVDARLVRAVFGADGRGWVFGEAGALYTTRDRGLTWARQRLPTRHLLLGGAFLDSERGWLVGAGATILQTADGGETWRTGAVLDEAMLDKPRVRFTAVSFVDARRGWAVGAKGHIFATRDGGRTWRAQVSNVESDLLDVKFTGANEGWACGTEGVLLYTRDGGARWNNVSSGTPHALERLCFINNRRGWAVGFGGTIITYDADTPARKPELRR